MHAEAAPLLRRLADRETLAPSPAGNRMFFKGRIGHRSVVVAVTGDGPARAGEGARHAMESFTPDRVIVLGVAGALSPDLHVGSRVLATRVFDDEGSVWKANADDLVGLARAAGARLGVALTGREIAASAERKAELRKRLAEWIGSAPGATEAMVVDLESAAIVEIADEHGIPWLVLRAVSDVSTQSLPAFLEGCRDGRGGVSRLCVALRALLRPRSMLRLLALRRRVRICAHGLADASAGVLEEWADRPTSAGIRDRKEGHQ